MLLLFSSDLPGRILSTLVAGVTMCYEGNEESRTMQSHNYITTTSKFHYITYILSYHLMLFMHNKYTTHKK